MFELWENKKKITGADLFIVKQRIIDQARQDRILSIISQIDSSSKRSFKNLIAKHNLQTYLRKPYQSNIKNVFQDSYCLCIN